MIDPVFRDVIIYSGLLTMMSLGITLGFMTTKVPNFAHASFVIFGAYAGLSAAKFLGLHPYASLPLAFAVGAVASLALYGTVIRPLLGRRASLVLLMVATLAFDFIAFAIANIYADTLASVYKIESRPFGFRSSDLEIFGLPGLFAVCLVLVAAIIGTLHFSLTRTKFGVAMRATVENAALAEVVGINTGLVYAVSWTIAGGLAGISGGLLPMWILVQPSTGTILIISVFAASLVGGIRNIYGPFLGGFVVGMAEILGNRYLTAVLGSWVTPYRPVIPLAIIVATLMVVPMGIAEFDWRSLLRKLNK
jgi:branched-chain amino acid transport system permease protein